MNVLVIDNYDSFTYNLVQYLGELGADVHVHRNDAISLDQIIYRVDALHWVERRGIPVVNSPRAIERSVDKFYTTALLQVQ